MNASNRPLLIYDGDCAFCVCSIARLRKLTGNAIAYRPYQEAADGFPGISIEEFRRAVQLIGSDGKVSSGAEASLLALAAAPRHGIWIKLYRSLPGFAWCAESVYAFVSTHRDAFYRISVALLRVSGVFIDRDRRCG